MKNVIFLVVDSFIYNKIGCTKYDPSPTPFIDSLKDKSIWCTNMFSQGPYTEAGNKARKHPITSSFMQIKSYIFEP